MFSGFDVLSLDLGLGLGTPESRFQSFDTLSVCLGLSLEQKSPESKSACYTVLYGFEIYLYRWQIQQGKGAITPSPNVTLVVVVQRKHGTGSGPNQLMCLMYKSIAFFMKNDYRTERYITYHYLKVLRFGHKTPKTTWWPV